MASNTSGADFNRLDPDHEEVERHLARLSRSDSHRRGRPRRRWVKRLIIATSVLIVILVSASGALYWRLGAGPINLEWATSLLVKAIQDTIGHDNTVEVGGTQIERAGWFHIALIIRDIVVRDHDRAVIASAPKVEVGLSRISLLKGQLRAERLNLVDAKLAIRITPDGYVTVSAGDTARPLATGVVSKKKAGLPPTSVRPGSTPVQPPATTAPGEQTQSGLPAGLDWLDSLSMTLDVQNLKEIGLKNGILIVDDQQRGEKWTFENIRLSLRRPSGGGAALHLGEGGDRPWSLRVTIGPSVDGVRSVDVLADKVSTSNILLALRLKDLTYKADLPLTGKLKGELGRDGLPTYFRGRIFAGKGPIIDTDTPDYPMQIDSAEIDVEWDSARRVLRAPFKVISGANRVTLTARLEPPNGNRMDWQLGFSDGLIQLAGIDDQPPLVFNRIDIRVGFDTDHKRILLTQANISNGEVGVAGTGSIDYAGEPRLTLGFGATPMSASALKRMWPILIVPELREWVIKRIGRGSLQRLEIGVNSPVRNLSRKGPPIPDDGLSVNMVANGVEVHPVDGMPAVHDADLKAIVTGRTATVTIGQAVADTPAGRKLTISNFEFKVPDMAPKPPSSRSKFRVDGPVSAAAEILASDRLGDLSATLVDPNTAKGNFTATISLDMPVKGEMTKADTRYVVNADLNGFAADKLVMNQKLEANTLKIKADNAGYHVKGDKKSDVKINGLPVLLDYRKPVEGDAEVKLQTTLDDASRARFGFDLGAAVSGPLPVKVSGKVASATDQPTKLGIECDLTQLKLDNVLPGWGKVSGKPGKVTFNVVTKPQSTRLDDIVVEGRGTSIRGSLEVDQNGDLMNANFPTYSPSDGDKASLKVERNPDGVMKATMRGEVFDGRDYLKSAISGGSGKDDSKSKLKNVDVDVDVKLGLVKGSNAEAMRSVDAKMSRRGGAIKAFTFNGKIGRDTPVAADLQSGRTERSREVIFLKTNDAGAFLRFTDIYAKASGGQLELSIEPPIAGPAARKGQIDIHNFVVKGDRQLDPVIGGPAGQQFTELSAELTRQNGVLKISNGHVNGPVIGVTIDGSIDYPDNKVAMSGTFTPVYGPNNLIGQIPVLGPLFTGGKNKGVIGVTYEVVGTPAAPVVRFNPASAVLPGPLRTIMEFNTGKQNAPFDDAPSQ